LADQGLLRYLGAAQPAESTTLASGDVVYEFAIADGPRCLDGGPFRTAVRHSDSDDLVIYLQGGGACSSRVCFVTFDDTDSIFVTTRAYERLFRITAVQVSWWRSRVSPESGRIWCHS
jgi:hypothetical protein